MPDDIAIRPAKILLVEDNPGDVILTQRSFSRCAANSISVASTGEEALEMIAQEVPDLVLMDINLPGMSGIEVLQAIRSNHDTKDIPVVMLTSSDAETDVESSYGHNVNGYLVKPPTISQLDGLVDVVVGHWFRFGRTPKHWSRR